MDWPLQTGIRRKGWRRKQDPAQTLLWPNPKPDAPKPRQSDATTPEATPTQPETGGAAEANPDGRPF